MHLKPSPDALAQQLWLLTLTLQHALGREDWEEANALFLRREQVLSLLEELPLSPAANHKLGEIQQLEAEMVDQIRLMQQELASEHKVEMDSRRARKVYRTTNSATLGVTLAS